MVVLVTADLVGLSTRWSSITADAWLMYGLERQRLLLNCSHNHSCPVTEGVLWLCELTADESAARESLYPVGLRQVRRGDRRGHRGAGAG